MKKKSTPDLAFEVALDQLEGIVDDLEQGTPELAEALARYERAVGLLAHCHKLIDGAERTIALLSGVDDQGQPVGTPFDATATAERENAAPARKVSPASAKPFQTPNSDESDPPF